MRVVDIEENPSNESRDAAMKLLVLKVKCVSLLAIGTKMTMFVGNVSNVVSGKSIERKQRYCRKVLCSPSKVPLSVG